MSRIITTEMNLDQILIFKLFDHSKCFKIVQNHTLERDETKINCYTVYIDQEDKAGGTGNKIWMLNRKA